MSDWTIKKKKKTEGLQKYAYPRPPGLLNIIRYVLNCDFTSISSNTTTVDNSENTSFPATYYGVIDKSHKNTIIFPTNNRAYTMYITW